MTDSPTPSSPRHSTTSSISSSPNCVNVAYSGPTTRFPTARIARISIGGKARRDRWRNMLRRHIDGGQVWRRKTMSYRAEKAETLELSCSLVIQSVSPVIHIGGSFVNTRTWVVHILISITGLLLSNLMLPNKTPNPSNPIDISPQKPLPSCIHTSCHKDQSNPNPRCEKDQNMHKTPFPFGPLSLHFFSFLCFEFQNLR